MYLVSKESIEKCRRSSNLKKLTYADGRRTPDRFVSDKLHLTIVSGAKKSFKVSINNGTFFGKFQVGGEFFSGPIRRGNSVILRGT